MTYNGIQLRQMTTCYRCGKVRKIGNVMEVGNDVYRCKDGCNG